MPPGARLVGRPAAGPADPRVAHGQWRQPALAGLRGPATASAVGHRTGWAGIFVGSSAAAASTIDVGNCADFVHIAPTQDGGDIF